MKTAIPMSPSSLQIPQPENPLHRWASVLMNTLRSRCLIFFDMIPFWRVGSRNPDVKLFRLKLYFPNPMATMSTPSRRLLSLTTFLRRGTASYSDSEISFGGSKRLSSKIELMLIVWYPPMEIIIPVLIFLVVPSVIAIPFIEEGDAPPVPIFEDKVLPIAYSEPHLR